MPQQAAQVYFPKESYLAIKLAAKRENKPLAAWIRDLALKEIKNTQKKRQPISQLPVFSAPDLDPKTSQNVDSIVYEHP